MTRGFLILLATSIPHWALNNWCQACDETAGQQMVWVSADGGTEGCATVKAITGQAGAEPMVIVANAVVEGDGQQPGQPHIVIARASAVPGAEGGEGAQEIRVRSFVNQKGFEDPNRGWLGVSVGDVPESLSAQLEDAEGGAIVLNIVKDSPAEKAGLLVHDIVISVGGEAIDGKNESTVMQTANLIGSHKPGDVIDIVVLREGAEKTIRATLGSRPNLEGVNWKFETLPHAQIEDQIKTRGKVFQVSPNGQWEWKSLGDLQHLGDLHKNFQFVPQSGNYTMKVFVDNGKKTIKSESKDEDGSTAVEQVDGGEITVTRTDANGKVTTKSYADADALRAADEDAAELYDRSSGHVFYQLGANGDDGMFDIKIELDDKMEELTENLEESFEQAQEAYQKAMEELHEAYGHLAEQHQGQGADGRSDKTNAKSFNWSLGPVVPLPPPTGLGKARQSFEVRPDGMIEVRIRKGDSELVQLYTNEADLQRKDAKLYEKYQELMADNE